MTEAVRQAYHVVSRELDVAVKKARVTLEDAVEGRSPRQALQRCAETLHEIRGVLRLVEVHGGALLAEEMEYVCRHLMALGNEAKGQREGLEALTRAMVQLPAYLERMLAGGRDIALVLLPMLNDLRTVRGKPLMSESTLLLLNLAPQEEASMARRAAPPSEDFTALSRRIRPAFQLALLGWLRADRTQAQQHLDKLIHLSQRFEDAADRDDVYRLWWVIGGVLQALRDGALETSVSIKRLLGQADRRIKRVIDEGPASFDSDPVTDLLNNLLYYIARVREPTGRVREIRDAFNLSDLLPGDEQVEHAREELAAPSIRLMETVAVAIKEDLATVKDVLDIHVRTGSEDLAALAPQVDMLRKISDTLGVLGLGDLRGDVQSEIERLQTVVRDEQPEAASQALLDIASTLLRVEGTLDNKLRQLIQPRDAEEPDPAPETSEEVDFQEVTRAVMRESLVNLARIKDTLSLATQGRVEPLAIDSAPRLLQGIIAGFKMLDLDEAADVFGRVGEFIVAYLNAANHTLSTEHQDRLADALVTIEYYMETIEAGRREPRYMLDNARTCLLVLDEVRARLEAEQVPVADRTMVVSPPDFADAGDEYIRTATIADSTEILRSPVVSGSAATTDPELLELFIEEAKEEVATIGNLMPLWADDPGDMESLITMRRSFHTLKGSGRMVSAERISEFSWHIEDLLNRLINRTLVRTPPMVAFIAEAAAAVPELIEQLEIGTKPKADIGLLTAKAVAFADGDPNAAELSREAVTRGQPALEMDPVLLEIFAKEAHGHLDVVRSFVDKLDPNALPVQVPDALHRACHTLHGSINTAGVDRIAPLSGAMNQLIRRVYDSGASLDADCIDLLRRTGDTIERVVDDINRGSGPDKDSIQPLVVALNDKTAEIAHAQTSFVDEEDAPRPAYEPTLVLTKAPPAEADEAAESDDYDPEIAEIFTEEAAEILEAADASLGAWSASRGPENLTELKRQLHTLKGGARMAGVSAIGDLSHELETLLIGMDDGRIEADESIDGLLRESFDELHRMRDVVISGQRARSAPLLEARVRQAAGGEAGAPDAGVEAAATPAPRLGDMVDISDFAAPADEAAEAAEDTGSDAELLDLDDIFAETKAGEEPATTGEAAEFAGFDVTAEDDEELFAETMISLDESEVDEPTAISIGLDPDAFAAEPSAGEFDEDDEDRPEFIETIVGVQPDERADLHVIGPDEQPLEEDEATLAATVAFERTAADAEPPVEEFAGYEDDDVLPDIEQSQYLEALIDDAADDFRAGVEPGADDGEAPAPEAGFEPSEPLEAAPDAFEPAADEAAEPEPEALPDNVTALPVPGQGLPQRDVTRERRDFAKVDSRLLEDLLNAAGEISIYHGRLEQQVGQIEFHLAELNQTVVRLREQLRQMEIETEAQILTRHQEESARQDFDPLELDRYSTIQQLSRALAETSSDVDSLRGLLQSVAGEADVLLTQQARVSAELQDGLMRTRMVPFDRHVARLSRLVRQAAAETGKQAELAVEGASGELDRQVLEKMLPPLEHMMRNAVVHGIETVSERQAAGKPPTGQITIRLNREGSEMVIDIADDGAGLDVDAIRRKALEKGLIGSDSDVSDEAVMELILTPGFSTAQSLTQAAGRGVGMDVVANEVKRLGGSLQITSMPGQGTNFTIRLPFTLAITQALIVRASDEVYALPLPTVEGVARVPRAELERLLEEPEPMLDYGERSYRLRHLAPIVGVERGPLSGDDSSAVPVIMVRSGEHSSAILADEMLASREIVVKSLGPQLASIRGISGATILGDGRVVLILDMPSLVRGGSDAIRVRSTASDAQRKPLVLVVDDSITVRRVTQRVLERNDYRVVTARDGLDAVSVIQEHEPDVILLDIEMPRMDGFEFATHVRNDPRFERVPIIMITSRTGEKHKARAIEIGVNDYLGKPYQDQQLLEAISRQLDDARKAAP